MDALELKFLALLLFANGAPILAEWLLGRRWARPLDGHRRFVDGRPLLGPTKTVRGVLSGVLVSAAAAPLLGLGLAAGVVAGVFSMLGDLLSSFVKRRLGLASSSMALGLDQVPEALLPALACMPVLHLGWNSVLLIVTAFFLIELAASWVLFRIGIRKRPY